MSQFIGFNTAVPGSRSFTVRNKFAALGPDEDNHDHNHNHNENDNTGETQEGTRTIYTKERKRLKQERRTTAKNARMTAIRIGCKKIQEQPCEDEDNIPFRLETLKSDTAPLVADEEPPPPQR